MKKVYQHLNNKKQNKMPFKACMNIGNALEAPKDISLGVDMKAEYFDKIKKAGFDSVRLPVRFSDYAKNSPNYTLDEEFMKQLDSYINYAINDDLVVILDFHNFLEIMDEPEKYKDCFMETLKKQNLNYSNIDETIKSIESTINENVYEKYKFIDGYSYMQKLMNKNEESNFEAVKDTDGILHYTYFADKPNSVHKIVSRVKAFNDGINDKNKKLIYLMTPDKYNRDHTKFETEIPYNYVNETADNFHYNMNLDKDGFYRNKENYNFVKYDNSYIGYMGRKAGIFYGGVDDFTIIYPKFKTSYSYYSKTGEQEVNLEGRFEESLLSVSPFTTKNDMYSLEADKYFSYLYGNSGLVHIHNKDNESGPKMLFIKDSLAVPLSAFLSTVCSDVYLIDSRYYKDDIPKFANETNLDYIIMSFYPQNLTEEFFPFYEQIK